MGGWFFVAPRIEEALAAAGRSIRIGYAGRKSSASPAPGYAKFFQEQQQAFVAEALGLVQEKTQKKQA
jgi:2-oxoglutarate dehydrogenase complex dehydrogenase (E1) component-like enzyme